MHTCEQNTPVAIASKSSKISLLLSDVDSTLLTREHVLTEQARVAISKLQSGTTVVDNF